MIRYRLFAAALISFWTVAARADEPPAHQFECRFAEGPIAIDGEASEADWQAAQTIDAFTAPWREEGERNVRRATRARLLWDREFLYFFADLDDADLFADIVEHDGRTWHNDVFELFFKPAEDKPGYYEFQVNAAGTELDIFFPQREDGGFERYAGEGKFDLESKVALRGTLNRRDDADQGWSVEGRLPWRDFHRTGGRPAIDEVWKFSLCRYDYDVAFDKPELSTCSPLTYPSFHAHEDFASLKFVASSEKNALKPRGVESFLPVDTSRLAGSPEPPLPYRAVESLAKLKLSYPIYAEVQPGTKKLVFIDQLQTYGKTRLGRTLADITAGNIESGEVETLLDVDGVATSFTFHPRFVENGYLYLGWNGPFEGKPKRTIVTRYTISREAPFAIDPTSALSIIEFESDGHNGAALAFGNDGMLYVTSGDGTSDSDTNVKGQGLDHLLSKLLRIDVDHPAEGQNYSTPADNPFVGQAGVRPETWAYGFRNPWRMTVDRATGHIWVGNNGQDLWEQAFLVERGANYGWSVFEGSHPFYPERQLGPTPHTPPTCEHPHSEARSLTGGVVYHGERFPELRGAYIYGDYSTGKIWGVKHDGREKLWHRELADTPLAISCFCLDPAGELLIVDHRANNQGGFFTLEATQQEESAEPFPRTLSETGLFADSAPLALHQMAPGVIPYSVNAPLWSDGAYKERYLALPADAKIDYTNSRGWGFPDGAVIVKSFALEGAGEAARRWIETRLMVKQQGEWTGYSYEWNEEQTEATLVPSAGADRDFALATGVQRWRYPSRSECMVCHSRAANYVLGLCTPQFNREHDYGDAKDNQLRMLENLGLLRVNYDADSAAAWRDELKTAGKTDEEIAVIVDAAKPAAGQRTSVGTSSLLAVAPSKLPRLVDPYDDSADLDRRARSYLHANCSMCHVEAGGGNAQFDADYITSREKTKLFDIRPVHHTFGIADARLVAPGAPGRSVLLHRLSIRGPGQMPQLATSVVDEKAVALIREWIEKQ